MSTSSFSSEPMIRVDGPRFSFVSMWRLRLRVEPGCSSPRMRHTVCTSEDEKDLTRHEGEAATSRRKKSVDHRLGSSALMKTKTSKR
uniref:Uncharacterized protein n=1 Tax=Angiostrongylus cantonensis TaxID=6313 RepID=A0A0K0DKT5_ANGCA